MDPAPADANAKHGARMMRRVLVTILFVFIATAAYADGGHVLLQQSSGSFTVTLFTSPEPITTGDADFSVLLQERSTGRVVLDTSIYLTLVSPSGIAQTVLLTREKASNKLLQAGSIAMKEAGHWFGSIEVRGGPQQINVPIAFEVAAGHSRRGIVITTLILPILVITFFLVSQSRRDSSTLKHELKAKSTDGRSSLTGLKSARDFER